MANVHSVSGRGGKASKRTRVETPPSPDSGIIPIMRSLLEIQFEKINERLSTFEDKLERETGCIKADLQELKTSLNYQGDEIEDLKGKLSTLEQELNWKEVALQEEMDNLAAYVARNNFVIMGLAETEGENVACVVEEFFITELKMTEEQAKGVKFERVHRANAKMKPRPIKARVSILRTRS